MWILVVVVEVVLFFFIFGNLTMRWSKRYRRVACKIGWHSYPSFDVTGSDGCSKHARCKWCGYEGMIDSQGNLF